MATKTKAKEEENVATDANESALQELFIDELKDIYWAEQHLSKALAKMAKNATSDELRQALETHMQETEGQIERLKQVFGSIEEKASAKKCEAMEGLIKEGEEIMKDTEKGSITRDVGIISAAQKAEHYEIASYGTLKTLATTLGYTEAAELLNQTLEEEKKTDGLLTQLAEGSINPSAKNEAK
ncbi:ferritin-like domain-containing protein [Mucilaginibacter sp. RS28]|uniref:Ferritin-like domain-containing protein n=1 Tax=Mucilaginibacter straminoryzae TaxID=2932774 RepID=A0A9X1X3S4_9SPHI|nr:ferritin-like domain-containing protein [Mucilaginibacter straminoryzae]MCJ8210642.1 ferritin-like domain-containing protein [Mucilaginibacter straminoryzae]